MTSVSETKKTTLRDAILAGKPRAWGKLADMVRNLGGTYRDTYERIVIMHVKAGREAPSLAEFDDMMQEADYEEATQIARGAR